MPSRLLLISLLITCQLTPAYGLVGGGERTKRSDPVNEVPGQAEIDAPMFMPASVKIPPWKLKLVSGNDDTWWSKYGFASISDAVNSALWGHSYPSITGSPAQNAQTCPNLKLPDKIVMSAKHMSWDSLYGEWETTNSVKVASFTQNYLGLGFTKDIKKISVAIRDPSTNDVAARTQFMNKDEIRKLYDWKEPIKGSGFEHTVKNETAIKDNTFEDIEHDWNLAIFDCRGTLMYVVKQEHEFPKYLKIYSRNGELLAESPVGYPILKYTWTDPKTNYRIAVAEAPGVGANITSDLIPEAYRTHHVLPVEMEFERSAGHPNISALVEPEYRWVLAAALQALTIYKAPQSPSDDVPWSTLTIIETFWAAVYVGLVVAFFGSFVLIYFCVYPDSRQQERDHYGKIAENPYFVTPPCPDHRDDARMAAQSRRNQANGNKYNYGSYNY
jgi:hypothetical protein